MPTTPRLILEDLRPSHAELLFPGLSDPQLYQFLDDQPPANEAALRSRYELLASCCSSGGKEVWRNWAIRVVDTTRYIGFVQATVATDRSAFIAYVLFRDAWGNGYGRESVAAMMDELQRQYDCTQFRATVDSRNRRSIALLHALGFARIVGTSLSALSEDVSSSELTFQLQTAGTEFRH